MRTRLRDCEQRDNNLHGRVSSPHLPNECSGTLSADDGNDDDDDTVIPTMMQSLKPVRDTSSTDTLSTTTTPCFILCPHYSEI